MTAEDKNLIDGVRALFASMQSFRKELAAIRHPADSEDRLDTMAEQLDAIVEATESATETILGTLEEISDMLSARRPELEKAGLTDVADAIEDKFQGVFEACSFQDLTGQRIGRVVRELKFLDERLSSMIAIWGREELSKVRVAKDDTTPVGERLEGPALAGRGVSQDDIDKLFD